LSAIFAPTIASAAILEVVTASCAIVKAPLPVTSPVWVALVTLAVLFAISVFIELANLAAVIASSATCDVPTALFAR
jgi:hypothetical protein